MLMWVNSTRRRAATAAAAASLLTLAACASGGRGSGPFVWVDDYAPAADTSTDYLIAAGDLVSVQVWDNEKLSTRARVRSDGRISMPLLGDVTIAGKAPKQVSAEVERELKEKNYVVTPRVNVLVDEVTPLSISVLGTVARPGSYTLRANGGWVAEAIAAAGGLTDFAHKDRIFVIRRTPQPVRIRFTFKSLTSSSGKAATFRLQSGDVVVAE
jgi:polysaccharide export outer membrane protein